MPYASYPDRMDQFTDLEKHCLKTLDSLEVLQTRVRSAYLKSDLQTAERLRDDAFRTLSLAKQNAERLRRIAASFTGTAKTRATSTCKNVGVQLQRLSARQNELGSEIERRKVFASNASLSNKNTGQTNNRLSNTTVDDSTAEEYSLFEQTMDVADRSALYLAESHYELQQSEHTGVSILENLDSQQESLLRAKEKVDSANSKAIEAGAALRRMAWRALYNKVLLSAIVLVLLALIGMVVYIKFLR